MIRLLGLALVVAVDSYAALALSGSVICALVVVGAGGWVLAQHDSNYRRVRGLDG